VPGRRAATSLVRAARNSGSPRDQQASDPNDLPDSSADRTNVPPPRAAEGGEAAGEPDPFDFGERALGHSKPTTPAGLAAPAAAGAHGPVGRVNARPHGPVLHLRWRGTVRDSYRGFFRNVTSDSARREVWIEHLLAAETRWQYRGQDVPVDQFERLANENHLQILPVFGGALPYIERVTGLRAAQLETINREVTRAERAAETALAHLDQIEQEQGGRNGGGDPHAVPGGEGSGQVARRAALGAAPSELRGPGRCVVGGRASYQMRVTLGADDTSDNPLEDARAIDRGTFTFEVFDATALARASNRAAADGARTGRGGDAPRAASNPDPLAAQAAVLQQGGGEGGRTVTGADGNRDSLGRIDRALSGDAARAAGEYEEARRDGRTADAIIGATNLLLTPTSIAVAYGGYALNRVVDAIFGNASERAVPFPAGGTFIVRCIAQPLRLDGLPARPPSVAVQVVEVAEAHAMAREALDEPAARIAELELRRDQAGDPGERVAAEQALANARTLAEGAPAAVIGLSRDRLEAERRRLSGQLAAVGARPVANPDEAFQRDSELRDLRAQRDGVEAQLSAVRTQLDLATARHAELGGATFRPRAVIVDEESGDRMELLLEVSEPRPQNDGYHCSVSDTTSARGHLYGAVAPSRGEAIWAALRAVANGNDYGRGRLFVRVPDTVALAGGRERDFTNAPGSTALLRQRLADLGTVASALATISVPGAGEVAMLLGATTAAANLATRLSEHTLHLDADAINDVLNVLTAAAAGVSTVGRLRVELRAFPGRVALAPEASLVARRAEGLATALDRIQVITTTYATMQQLDDLARQEASGAISHARARELRARALLGNLQVMWTTASSLARGGDGPTGDAVIRLPDAPAAGNAEGDGNAVRPPNGDAPSAVAANSDAPAATAEHSAALAAPSGATTASPPPGQPALAAAGPHPGQPAPAAGPLPGQPAPAAAGPNPGQPVPAVAGPLPGPDTHQSSVGVDPDHRDAIVPPPPVEQNNTPTLVPPQPGQPQSALSQGADQANIPTLVPPPAQPQSALSQGADQANIPTLVPPPPAHATANASAAHAPADAAHAPTLVPPPPSNALEAHQLARAQRVAALILTLPRGTRIVPDATPGPLPASWMRLAELSAYLRMLGRLRTAASGRDILYDIANHDGTITMNAGVGHYQSGAHINIDPRAHTTSTGRAGAVGHEGDHLTRRSQPDPRAHATEDSYVAAIMQHEALAQARLLEVRRGMLEADGHRVAPHGANVHEAGAAAYYTAYDQARAAHLAAHPGDPQGAHDAGTAAGVAALAAMWRGVLVSIPGAGTYDQYARRNYRAARGERTTTPGH
jgi:hypothetical protein